MTSGSAAVAASETAPAFPQADLNVVIRVFTDSSQRIHAR
jgi:hypothetical protein